jgi:acyl carrier protein
MTTDTIRDEVRAFIIGNFMFGQGGGSLTDDQSFLESGIVDSTGVLELIGFLEQHYSIAVADDEVLPANLDSVSQLVHFVRRKQQAA